MEKALEPRRASRRFCLAVAFLSFITLIFYGSVLRLTHSFEALVRAHQTHEMFQTVELLMESAETAVRGYVITGDTGRLNAYDYARLMAPYELRELSDLASVDPQQRKTLEKLSSVLGLRLQSFARLVRLRRAQGYGAAAREMMAGEDASLRD